MYKEIYNIMGSDAPGLSLPLSLGIAAIFLTFLFFKVRSKSILLKIFPYFSLIVIVGVIFSRIYSTQDYRELKSYISNREFTRLEGEISNFIPYSDSNAESVTVGDKTFSYGNTPRNAAFNRSNYSGEVFSVGTEVRIFYVKDRILAIWVKE